jgi:Zn-dependent peptidase ImmA (M78 family)
MTIFNDGVIQVFNHITEKLEFTHVKAGTIFIDTSLTGSASTTRRRFTCAHEASHWLLHRSAFASKKWNSEYMVSRTGQPASVIRKDSENRRRMEQQANFLAAALLMPKTTLRMLFCEFCKDRDIKPRTLIRSAGDGGLAHTLTGWVAERYQVSHQAAQIRLEKLGAVR